MALATGPNNKEEEEEVLKHPKGFSVSASCGSPWNA
jgi:hypothetical protein